MLLKIFVPTLLILLVLLQFQCTIPEPDDITPPVVAVIYPYTGSVLSGTVNMIVDASDDDEVTRVWLYIDSDLVGLRGASNATFEVDVTPYADDQTHLVQGKAEDKSGNRAVSQQVLVTISKSSDIVPPMVTIVNPQNNQQVQDTVKVLATADDDRKVGNVAFFVNGDSVHADNIYPYEYEWVTSELADSTSHTIFAKAFDVAGNWSLSPLVTVTVFPRGDKTPPSVILLDPQAGSTLNGTVEVRVDAVDIVGVTLLEFYVDGILVAMDNDAPWGFSWDTSTLSLGLHALYIKAFDAAGNVGTTPSMTFTIANNPDVTPPSLLLLYPNPGSTLSGIVDVVVDASDDVGITLMEFYVDGVLDTTDNVAPWGFPWNTTGLFAGTHTLYIKAFDAAGNIGTVPTTTFSVELNPDLISPTVSLLYPTAGSTLSGNVDVAVDAYDNVGVTSVEFYVDGILESTDTSSPWGFTWNTTALSAGTHTLYVKAYDAAGNFGTLSATSFTIADDPDLIEPTVTLLYPTAGSTLSGNVDVAVDAYDNVGVTSVEFYVDGSLESTDTNFPWGFTWNTAALSVGTHTLYVKAYDAAGNVGTLSTTSFTIDDPDLIAPTVTLLYPTAGSTLSGNVDVAVDAYDNVGVVSVEFYVDGLLESTDINYPWGFTWNTAALPVGTHTLYVKAYDAAGNVGTLSTTSFTIDDPDLIAPTVTLLYPTAGSTLSGNVDVAVDAYDNVGVVSVEFYVDGLLESTDTNYPWGFTWNTAALSAGTHTLYVKAYDAAGNVGTLSATSFTIADDPDLTPPTLTLLYPIAGSILSGSVNVGVDVNDNVGVDRVKFYVDGVLDNTDIDEPWGFLWNTTPLDSGLHTLYMKGYDTSGNIGTLGPITFTVN